MKRLYWFASTTLMTIVIAAALTPVATNTAAATGTQPTRTLAVRELRSGTRTVSKTTTFGVTPKRGTASFSTHTGPSALSGLKLMNYYPAYHGWSRMWFEWYPATIQSDFARMSGMGANAVRLILPTDVFGYPAPSSLMLERLSYVIQLADAAGLKVQLTLFENWSAYSDVSGSEQWAARILDPYKGDPRIAFVEIKNELNPYNSTAMAWARTMIPYVRAHSGLPVAASNAGDLPWFNDFVSALNASRPDIFSYHFYGDPSNAAATFYWVKRIAAPTQVFIGETGLSTGTTADGPSDPSLEQSQDSFFHAVDAATLSQGLPAAAPWIMWDFAPGTLCTCAPDSQYHYGLLRLDGSEKPAFATVKTFFTTGVA